MIARVFPRKTKATPDDPLVFFGPPGMFTPKVDEVHVSVTFTWDIPKAELLARQWEGVAPVHIGGPALGDPGGDFTPGMYVKKGYVMTSRGCPNQCWFCDVWKREGDIWELPITEGWNVLDSNLLACSWEHQEAVFQMLKNQKERVRFTGGLEAERFTKEHLKWMVILKPEIMWFAYDCPGDYEPLDAVVKLFRRYEPSALTGHRVRAYVLCGFKGDTRKKAEERIMDVVELGIMPMAMLFNKGEGLPDRKEWIHFQKLWARPHIVGKKMRGTQ